MPVSHPVQGARVMREGTLVSSRGKACSCGCLHPEATGRADNDSGDPCWELNIPLGLVTLSALFSSLGLCRCTSRLPWPAECHWALPPPASFTGTLYSLFLRCHLLDNRILRPGETGSDVEAQGPPNLLRNTPRSS